MSTDKKSMNPVRRLGKWQGAPLEWAVLVVACISFFVCTLAVPQKADAAVFSIASSTRFISGNSDYLNKTPGGAGNRTTWTFSAWVKRGALTSTQTLFSAGPSGTETTLRIDDSTNAIDFIFYSSSAVQGRKTTSALMRDPATWIHVVFVADTSNATAADRMRIYVNGTRLTSFSASTDPSSGYQGSLNNTVLHEIGRQSWNSSGYFDGYMSDVYMVDGQALAPTDFGLFDANGYWRAKAYSGTYGTNGFHLPLMGTSTAAGIGIDTSGNSNTWTVNNIAVTDFVKDSPTNSFATLSPINASAVLPTITKGNLRTTASTDNVNHPVQGTFAVNSGKWYYETYVASLCTNACGVNNYIGMGWARSTFPNNNSVGSSGSIGFWRGRVDFDGSTIFTASGSHAAGDVLMTAVDVDNHKVWFGKNGTWENSGNPATGVGAITTSLQDDYWKPLAETARTGETLEFIFGQGATTTLAYDSASGGYFRYTPPSGFKALSTANLPTPAIQKSKSYFDAYAYTGTGAATSSTHFAFSPSLVWIKNRTDAVSHAIFDSVRGVQKFFSSNASTAEDTDDTQSLSAFGSTGFSLGSGASTANVNTSAKNYISWVWKESATAGFDIVTYSGNDTANRNISHSLGAAPDMVIVKRLDGTGDPYVWHTSLTGAAYFTLLDSTAAQSNTNSPWGTGNFSSTQFMVTNNATNNANAVGATITSFTSTPVGGTWTVPAGVTSVTYLVVAGGGGGGFNYGGGGGAGGFRTGTLSTTPGASLTVTVGAGGAGATNDNFGTSGNNSVFDTITSTGGGGGGSRDTHKNGVTGGSGGGGSNDCGTAGLGTAGQGNDGGRGTGGGGCGDNQNRAGGGGGASAVGTGGSGEITTSGVSGNGGAGTASSISGSSVTYAGGGGGGGYVGNSTSHGVGGSGGGGNGADSAASVAGTANTGGGGGGGNSTSAGASGGSGVVIISYAPPSNYVAYLFKGIDGFSKFGSYTGNGSADGSFIYTGFKPRYLLVKRVDGASAENWVTIDAARDPSNPVVDYFTPNSNGAENSAGALSGYDFLSNGFKSRGTGYGNTSSGTYIYAAFAEQPFKLSAMPGTSEATTSRVIRLWGGVRLRGGVRLF